MMAVLLLLLFVVVSCQQALVHGGGVLPRVGHSVVGGGGRRCRRGAHLLLQTVLMVMVVMVVVVRSRRIAHLDQTGFGVHPRTGRAERRTARPATAAAQQRRRRRRQIADGRAGRVVLLLLLLVVVHHRPGMLLLLLLLVRMLLAHGRVERQVTDIVAALRTGRSAFRFGWRHLRRRCRRVGVQSAASAHLLSRFHHLLVFTPSVLEPNFHLKPPNKIISKFRHFFIKSSQILIFK